MYWKVGHCLELSDIGHEKDSCRAKHYVDFGVRIASGRHNCTAYKVLFAIADKKLSYQTKAIKVAQRPATLEMYTMTLYVAW